MNTETTVSINDEIIGALEDYHHLVWAIKNNEPVKDTNMDSIVLIQSFVHALMYPGPYGVKPGPEADRDEAWKKHRERIDNLITDIKSRWGEDVFKKDDS